MVAGSPVRVEHFARVPALDGLRAVAVLAVLGFHAQVGMPGGFLGVSLFFTLSGYLITSLLLVERSNTGRVDLSAFWSRRFRRLLPASLLCITLVLAAGSWWVAAQRRDLPGDVMAALAYVANWHFALGETSYQDLFTSAPSPLAHFWSLAIEEQIYLVLPLLAALCLRRSRRCFAAVAVALLGASVVATWLTTDRDLVYQGTHTRAAEMLVGVLLAIVLPRIRVPLRLLGAAGVAALVVLATLTMVASTADAWVYRGGLVAVAVLSATAIAAASAGVGPARVLAWGPLVAVGMVSYGLYLYHWPVFLLLDEQRTGLAPIALLPLRLAVTAVLTVASYRLLEQPVRTRRILRRPARSLFVAVTGIATLAIAAVVVVPPPHFTDTEQLLALGERGVVRFDAASTDTGARPVATYLSAPDRAPSVEASVSAVLVVGSDPTPVRWLADGYPDLSVIDGTQPGCAVASSTELLLADGSIVDQHQCRRALEQWAELARMHRAAVIVASFGTLDRGLVRRTTDLGYPAPDDLTAAAARWDAVEEDIGAAMAVLFSLAVPVVVVDAASGAGGVLGDVLARLDLHHAELDGIQTTPEELTDAVGSAISPTVVDEAGAGEHPLRVLVTGDSVSLDLARALSDGGDGRLDVTWAGENGCPFARVEAFRLAADLPWAPNDCVPFDERLPPLLDELRPDVVLLSVSVLELAEQRFPGDPEAHVAGDLSFGLFHDQEIEALVALLAESATPLLVADALGLRAGQFATEEMADPDRLVAWNDLVASWATRHDHVAVFPFAGPVRSVEDRFGIDQVVPDGVHPTIEALTELARWVYVPLLFEQTAQLGSAS